MEQRGGAREVTKVETEMNLKSAVIALKVAAAPEELIKKKNLRSLCKLLIPGTISEWLLISFLSFGLKRGLDRCSLSSCSMSDGGQLVI